MTIHITSDWHIHSLSSYDGHVGIKDLGRMMQKKGITHFAVKDRSLPEIMKQHGITDFGVSEHFTTPSQLYDLLDSRRNFDEVKTYLEPGLNFHFGVEINVATKTAVAMMQQGLGDRNFGVSSDIPDYNHDEMAAILTEEIVTQCPLEYVIGGVHFPYAPWERQAIIQSYHKQMLFLAEHPLVTIIAHPWWFGGHWANPDGTMTTEPWYDDFAGKISRSLHDEFAAAVIQHHKVVEIHLHTLLAVIYTEKFLRDYLNYLAYLKSRGIKLSIGSDCHGPNYTGDYMEGDLDLRKAEALLDSVGITDADIWCLKK